MSDEIKKTVLNTFAEPIANSAKNMTDKPSQNIGTTLADIWYLVFGGISQAAEKRKLKYSYALQEFEKELKEKISKIPEDKLVEPDIQIVVPGLEAAKYCVEKENLRKMYANLITASINSDTCSHIHPIFLSIISKMSSYDGYVLESLYYDEYKNKDRKNNAQKIDINTFENEQLYKELDKRFLSWMTLEQLGLVYTNIKEFALKHLNGDLELENYSEFETHLQSGNPILFAKINDLGEAFYEICIK